MKKRMPVLVILILFIVHGRAVADIFAGAMPTVLSVSAAAEYVPEQDDNEMLNSMFGLGIQVPLLFEGKELYFYFMAAPALAVEYNFDSLLRLRGGLHIGILLDADEFFLDYYVGASGIYMQDFTNNVPIAGISAEIGFEVYIPYFPNIRVQLQTDFLSIERYNRFGCTISFIFPLKKPDFHY
ncbi:MAG: hypothetical protein Pg6C_15130 [Treponemataceae bacterium]|nr:MAG: hypothetical protein Pg6C_15130 [Treponemataceae bacterium]